MSSTRVCGQCGAEVSGYSAEGLCPKCMLLGGLDPGGDEPTPPPAPGDRPSAIPNPESKIQNSKFKIGTLRYFGDYELLEEIARGGMGVVYKARQVSLNRLVAVKMILAGQLANAAALQRFLAEAEAAANLHHPNIVAIYEVGEHDGQHYFSMEYVEGQNLAALVREKPLPAARAAQYVRLIAEAIQYAHERGTLHRDLKPSNVLLDAFDQPRITDFGLAKQVTSESDLTLSGQVLGTPSFMPPEQAAGRRGAMGPASDVYSLGAILYHLVTGRPPFAAVTVAETLRLVEEVEPVPPRLLNPGVPRDLETICLKCIEKNPANRYLTARALGDELSCFLRDEPIQARPVGTLEKIWRWCRRKPVLAGMAATLIVVFSAGLVGIVSQWRRAESNAAKEATQRRGTEQANLKLEMQRAESLLSGGDLPAGLGQMARLLRQQPTNQLLAERLFSALSQHNFPLPLTGPLEHQAPVRDAQFSPDGLRVVTASEDKTARVWDALTGLPLTKPLQHEATVRHASFGPDGRWVVTASEDNTARVWDSHNGEPVSAPLRHDGDVRTAQFSPDGKRILTGSEDRTACVWEADSSRRITTVRLDGGVQSAEFSPDGQRVATASVDGSVRTWNAQTGEALGRAPHMVGAAFQAHFSRDGQRLVACCGSTATVLDALTCQPAGTKVEFVNHHAVGVQFSPSGRSFITVVDTLATVWDSQTNQTLIKRLEHRDGIASSVEFSADGLFILTASRDRTAVVWDARTGQPLCQPLRHQGRVNSAHFSPDGRRVVTASSDNTARVWDIGNGRQLPNTTRHVEGVSSAQFSPDGLKILTFGRDMWMMQWSAPAGGQIGTEAIHSGWAKGSAKYSPDGQRIASTTRSARIWDARTGQPLTKAFGAVGDRMAMGIHSVEFSPDGQRIVTTSADKAANIWDVQTGNPLAKPLPHQNTVDYAQFSADGQKVVTASWDRTARVWDARTGEPLGQTLIHDAEVNRAKFSPDTKRVLTASRDGTARVWDAATGAELFRLRHDNDVVDAEFSRDGKRILTASRDTTARLWDALTGQPVGEALKHNAQVTVARLSPDGERVITGSADRTARVWSAQTGQPLTDPFGFDDTITAVEFSPHGQQVVVASEDGRAEIWDLPRAPLPVPEWLPTLVECLAGQRVNETGVLESGVREELLNLKGKLANNSGQDAYSSWARWFFADRNTRTISAGSTMTMKQYVEDCMQWPTLSTAREAARLAPTNGLALARLAGAMMERKRSISNTVEEIEFLSDRAVQMSPDNGEVWRGRALVLDSAGKLAGALEAIERALQFLPKSHDFWNTKGLILGKTNRLEEAHQCFSKAIELKEVNSKSRPQLLTQYRSNRCELLKRMGRLAEAAADNLKVYGIQARDPQANPELLDLSAFYNVNLTNKWKLDNFLVYRGLSLPPGLHRFAGVDFDVRGVVQVAITDGEKTLFPNEVQGIVVGRAVSRVQFLHADVIDESETKIKTGSYVVHYADGRQQEIPLFNGKQIGAWYDSTATEAEEAWQGIDRTYGPQKVQLYKFTWQNPRPQVEVRSLDVISAGTNAAPFVVAITVE